LLTGATGVVGQALLPTLSDSTTICLVHRTPVQAPNTISIPADITQPRLGLSREAFVDLSSRIDCVVHTAAVVRFGESEATTERTNVAGTAHVLELAARAGVPVYHFSTAYVGVRSRSESAPSAYELTKRQGDELVRSSGLKATTLRPSVVIGESTSGRVSHFQAIYVLLGMCMKGHLPVLPALANSIIDCIPTDVIARAVAALIARRVEGGEFWLTSGERALTLSQVIDACYENAERLVGRAIARPRFVAPDVFDRLIKPVFLPELPPRVRRSLEQALDVGRYMNTELRFPSSLDHLESLLQVHLWHDPKQSLVRCLEFLAATSSAAGRPLTDDLAA
jgi:nucleoside-diphosphate-sugar epimerase